MKLSTLVITSFLLVAMNASASQRHYYNQIGVANLTGKPISNLVATVGKQGVQCDTVNNNGYCHKMFGKRPFSEDGVELRWTDADGNQQKQQVDVTAPASISPGRTLRFELEIHEDGSVKWDFRTDGIRS